MKTFVKGLKIHLYLKVTLGNIIYTKWKQLKGFIEAQVSKTPQFKITLRVIFPVIGHTVLGKILGFIGNNRNNKLPAGFN